MFDGPWGGFLGLIVFGLLTVIGYKYFDGPRQLTQKEREAEQKRIKEQLEWDKILEEENNKKSEILFKKLKPRSCFRLYLIFFKFL